MRLDLALVNARFLAENPRNPGNSRSSHLPMSLSYLLQKLIYIKTEVNLAGSVLLIIHRMFIICRFGRFYSLFYFSILGVTTNSGQCPLSLIYVVLKREIILLPEAVLLPEELSCMYRLQILLRLSLSLCYRFRD